MTQPNRQRYLASVSAELKAQATRVRDLIGDAHWLTDGHHKEYLVKASLARHLPSAITFGRGFVVHPQRSDLVSREQDLLVVDTRAVAPVFAQGGVTVAFPSQVLGAIAVKTTLTRDALTDACETLHSVRRVCAYAGVAGKPWFGVLFFEPGIWQQDALCKRVGEVVADFEDGAEQVGELPSGPDVIAVLGHSGFVLDPSEAMSRRSRVRGFEGDGAVIFLNSLQDAVALARGANAAEFEAFAAGIQMPALAGSPYVRA